VVGESVCQWQNSTDVQEALTAPSNLFPYLSMFLPSVYQMKQGNIKLSPFRIKIKETLSDNKKTSNYNLLVIKLYWHGFVSQMRIKVMPPLPCH
jgi:hypothetical protein